MGRERGLLLDKCVWYGYNIDRKNIGGGEMMEKLGFYLDSVSRRIDCLKCKESFLRERPLFVFLLLGHVYPVSYTWKVGGSPEFGLKLCYFPSFCGKSFSSPYIPCVFGYHYVFSRDFLDEGFILKLAKAKPSLICGSYLRADDLKEVEVLAESFVSSGNKFAGVGRRVKVIGERR